MPGIVAHDSRDGVVSLVHPVQDGVGRRVLVLTFPVAPTAAMHVDTQRVVPALQSRILHDLEGTQVLAYPGKSMKVGRQFSTGQTNQHAVMRK